MKQKKHHQKIFTVICALVLLWGLAGMRAIAKNDNAGTSKASVPQTQGKATGSSNSEGKSADVKKVLNLKNFEKADKSSGRTNAQVHKEKTQEVIQNLEKVAAQEETIGNVEVSTHVEQIAQEQDQVQEPTTEALEKTEERGRVKTFFIGIDYKNLGQLRSSLVQNRNQIRKLTQAVNQVRNSADQTMLQEQLETLMQERERIKTVIVENENAFSLFGWITRFLSGYAENPVDVVAEGQLATEVEQAIKTADEAQENLVLPVDMNSEPELDPDILPLEEEFPQDPEMMFP